MKRADAIAILKTHAPELKELGVASLSLFGSTARDEATDLSDVDVAVRLEGLRGGFATFGRLSLLKYRLGELLRARVDVIPEPDVPGPLKAAIDKDRCIAF